MIHEDFETDEEAAAYDDAVALRQEANSEGQDLPHPFAAGWSAARAFFSQPAEDQDTIKEAGLSEYGRGWEDGHAEAEKSKIRLTALSLAIQQNPKSIAEEVLRRAEAYLGFIQGKSTQDEPLKAPPFDGTPGNEGLFQ